MSNRTNRTLSANSPRLNLGTRSLAILAGAELGTTDTLRFRPVRTSHPGAFPRVGRMMQPQRQPSIPIESPEPKPATKPAGKQAFEGCDGRGCRSSSPGSSSRLTSRSPLWRPSLEVGAKSVNVQVNFRVVADLPPVLRQDALDVPSSRPAGDRQGRPTMTSRAAALARAYQAYGHASRSARPTRFLSQIMTPLLSAAAL